MNKITKFLFSELIDNFIFLFFLISTGVWVAYSQIVPANSGLGWDGTLYAAMISDFQYGVNFSKISSYYIGRFMPMISVYSIQLAANFFNVSLSILEAFQILNVLSMALTLVILRKICKIFQLSITDTIIAFFMLCASFIWLKQIPFVPVSVDSCALLVSFLIFYSNIKKSRALIIFSTLVSAFTWQLAFFYGIISIALFHSKMVLNHKYLNRMQLLRTVLVTFVFSVVVCGFFALFEARCKEIIDIYILDLLRNIGLGAIWIDKINKDSIYIKLLQFTTGLPSIVLLVLVAIRRIFHMFYAIKFDGKNTLYSNIFWLSIVFLFAKGPAILFGANNLTGYMGGLSLINLIQWMIFPLSEPFAFYNSLISPVLLFGVPFVYFYINFDEVFDFWALHSPSTYIFLIFGLFFFLPTEPRYVLTLFPILLLSTILLKSLAFSTGAARILIVLFIPLILSKVYLNMVPVPWVGSDDSVPLLLQYPRQLFFATYGPWMSFTSYIMQLPIIIIIAIILLKNKLNTIKA